MEKPHRCSRPVHARTLSVARPSLSLRLCRTRRYGAARVARDGEKARAVRRPVIVSVRERLLFFPTSTSRHRRFLFVFHVSILVFVSQSVFSIDFPVADSDCSSTNGAPRVDRASAVTVDVDNGGAYASSSSPSRARDHRCEFPCMTTTKPNGQYASGTRIVSLYSCSVVCFGSDFSLIYINARGTQVKTVVYGIFILFFVPFSIKTIT